MSEDEYTEWQRQDELWQQRLAAGDDPGPRTPPAASASPGEAVSGRAFGAEFADDDTLPPARRRALALLRGYKRHVSSHTPNVCTQPVSCSAFAAQAVRAVGTSRAVPLIINRLRICSVAAKERRRV